MGNIDYSPSEVHAPDLLTQPPITSEVNITRGEHDPHLETSVLEPNTLTSTRPKRERKPLFKDFDVY